MVNRVLHIRWIKAFATGVLFLIAGYLQAQSPVVTTRLSKNKILIGQQFTYRVDARFPLNSYRVHWFSLPGELAGFQVVTPGVLDTFISNGNINYSQSFVLTSFDSGRRILPAMQISLEKLNGDSALKMFTDAMTVDVYHSPLDSIQPFHDIKPIIELHKGKPWWVWALIALGILLFALLAWWIIRRLRRKKQPELFISKVPPLQEAMESLARLESDRLLEKNEYDELHTRLTQIYKRYISRVANSSKMHFTTDEMLMDLQSAGLTTAQVSMFAHILRMGNAVKFARYIPPAYENENCIKGTRELIKDLDDLLSKKEKIDS